MKLTCKDKVFGGKIPAIFDAKVRICHALFPTKMDSVPLLQQDGFKCGKFSPLITRPLRVCMQTGVCVCARARVCVCGWVGVHACVRACTRVDE